MAVRDFAAELVEEEKIGSYNEKRFILYPKHWINYPNQVSLTWDRVKFTESNKRIVPNDKFGIYSFVADSEIANHPACSYLFYIGKTDGNFRTRYTSYLNEEKKQKPRDHIIRMKKRWPNHLWFYYAAVSDKAIVKQLEDELITAFLPPMNRTFPAQIRSVMRMVFS